MDIRGVLLYGHTQDAVDIGYLYKPLQGIMIFLGYALKNQRILVPGFTRLTG